VSSWHPALSSLKRIVIPNEVRDLLLEAEESAVPRVTAATEPW
jgi:hypothetical protein